MISSLYCSLYYIIEHLSTPIQRIRQILLRLARPFPASPANICKSRRFTPGFEALMKSCKQRSCIIHVGAGKLVKRRAVEELIEGWGTIRFCPLTLARIKKRRKILKKTRNYDKVRCRDELAFPALRKEAHEVGKGPSGKECGKGICRRKDGKLSAGYPARNGARREKRFDPLPKARSWLADALHEDKRAVWRPSCEMTEDWSFEHQNRHGSLCPCFRCPLPMPKTVRAERRNGKRKRRADENQRGIGAEVYPRIPRNHCK